jgi:hypothetical protein
MENNKRSKGKLLLCLLTVFVMVSGGFATFVSSAGSTDATEPMADELGSEPREIGKQPISANDESSTIQETSEPPRTNGRDVLTSSLASDNGIDGPAVQPSWATANDVDSENVEVSNDILVEADIQDDTMIETPPNEGAVMTGGTMFGAALPETGETQTSKGPSLMGSDGPTTQSHSCSANGPYGTQANPLHEGDTVPFDGEVINPHPGDTEILMPGQPIQTTMLPSWTTA